MEAHGAERPRRFPASVILVFVLVLGSAVVLALSATAEASPDPLGQATGQVAQEQDIASVSM